MEAETEELCRRGDALASSASSPSGLAPCLRLSRLQSARSLYLRALDRLPLVDNEPLRASTCAKLGSVHLALAKLGASIPLPPLQAHDHSSIDHAHGSESMQYPLFYLTRSASYFSEALANARVSSKPLPWLPDQVNESLAEIARILVAQATKGAESAISSLEQFTRSPAYHALQEFCNMLSKTKHKTAGDDQYTPRTATAIAYLGQAECFLHFAFKDSQSSPNSNGNIRDCLKTFQRCHSLLQAAQSNAGPSLLGKLQHLHSRVESGIRFCECAQAMRAGAKFAKQANEATDPSMRIDFGLGAIDMYKEAEAKARSLDKEAQSIALISVGKVYEEILRSPIQAIGCYHTALDLVSAESHLKDRDLYEKAKSVLERLELEVSTSLPDKRKQKLKEELQNSIERVQDQSSRLDALSFLRFISRTHPPLKVDEGFSKAVEESSVKMSPSSVRVLIRKAIRLYHPDANTYADELWKVLAQEITKCLLLKYSCFKEEREIAGDK